MTPNPSETSRPGWLSPLVYLSNNWVSLAGVVIVTTAVVFWLFLLPTTLKGEATSPYIGILVFLGLPAPFFAGLIMIPLGIWLKRRREGVSGIYPPDFPPLPWHNFELRKLVASLCNASEPELAFFSPSLTRLSLTCSIPIRIAPLVQTDNKISAS